MLFLNSLVEVAIKLSVLIFTRARHVHIIILSCVRTTDDASCTQLHISRNRNVCHVRPVIRHRVGYMGWSRDCVRRCTHRISWNRVYNCRDMALKCVNYLAACYTNVLSIGSNYNCLFFFATFYAVFLLQSTIFVNKIGLMLNRELD